MKNQAYHIAGFLLVVTFASCQEEFLNVKSDVSIAAPSKIEDFQALLDNSTAVMNIASPHTLMMVGGEEFYILASAWHAAPVTNNRLQQKNAYIWADDVYGQEEGLDWNTAYHRILYANIASDGLGRLNPSPDELHAWNNAFGSARFFRAWNHYLLAQTFCKPYDDNAGRNLGLPLRMDADVTAKVGRSSLQETYDCMIDDLGEAVMLLPDKPMVSMRPSKVAGYALLAKIHLQMDQYDRALQYANMALAIQDDLLDYNELDASRTYPFTADYGQSNPEIIFYNWTSNFTIMNNLRMHVTDELLELYGQADLRRSIFYREGNNGNTFFRGSYTGGGGYFAGIGTTEVWLVRAECLARQGDADGALDVIRRLWEHRYLDGQFELASDPDASAVLGLVLEERRRELAFRGVRWEDIRRLNKEGRFAKTLTREIDGQIFNLPPNSNKYVWPIPNSAVQLGGIQQNDR